MKATNEEIRKAVENALQKSLITDYGSWNVPVGDDEIGFRWEEGKATILDEDGYEFLTLEAKVVIKNNQDVEDGKME